MNTKKLLQNSAERLAQQTRQVKEWNDHYDGELLRQRPTPKSWCVLECLEHLNLVNTHYVREIEQALQGAKGEPQNSFRPGFLGDKMVRAMSLNEEGEIAFRTKTFPSSTPHNTARLNADTVINQFNDLQKRMLECVSRSGSVDLNRAKVTSLVGPIFRLKLGDAIRLIVGHNDRHLLQAQRALRQSSPSRAI